MSIFLIWLIVCGIALNTWLGFKVGKVIGYCLAMLFYAVSYTRWVYAAGRAHGFKSMRFHPLLCLPHELLSRWWWFIENGSNVRAYSRAGVWDGIGNWTVFPTAQTEESSAVDRAQGGDQ